MPPAHRQQLARLIPVPHPDVREIRRTARGVVLRRTHRPDSRDVEIDALGASVLQALDGNKSLEDLRSAFAEQHRLSPLESRALLLGFVRDLRQRGLIRIESLDDA